MATITKVAAADLRFDLAAGVGTDALHVNPQYGYAVTTISTDGGTEGVGLTFTLGGGTNLVSQAIELLGSALLGHDIDELMSGFGEFQQSLAEHHQFRWLGPHKGAFHLALASITNACFDLWAKSRTVPLWKLLLDLSSEQVIRLVDWSYLDELITAQEAIAIIEGQRASRPQREPVLQRGYPGYDTSMGWLQYSDEQICQNACEALDRGFTAVKLKVGSLDLDRDVRRAHLVREIAGVDCVIALDANQAWSFPRAVNACERLRDMDPFWIEEPTQPDDILAHQALARAMAPVPIAVGEAVSNRVLWKNFLQAGAVGIVQADCTRLAGISEYLAVSIMAKKFPVRVIPHIGDMGQIHQHLVLFNHIAIGHEVQFLECMPHLREHFVHPARVEDGVYHTPQEPGASTDLWALRPSHRSIPGMHRPHVRASRQVTDS